MNLTSVARPYAKAAFEYAANNNAVTAWVELLTNAAELAKQKAVVSLVNDPSLAEEKVYEVIAELLKITDENQQRFIQLLVDYHRIVALPEILQEFLVLKQMHDKAQQVEVIAATELNESQQQALSSALEKRFGKKIIMTQTIDKTVLGGAIVRVGDLVIDGSIRGRLNNLRDYLKGEQL